jgi:xanthine dehydrogenase YagS FAD-binding subunit
MRPFEYARPETEAEAVEFLNEHRGNTAVLAGGTDLLNLLKADLATPSRLVDLKHIPSLKEVRPADGGVQIGALVTLADLDDHPLVADYRSLLDVVDGVRSIQIQCSGTIGGDLCHQPNCWYFRNGHGLVAWQDGESLVAAGDNRYHAILGNQGPAKYVNASRFAPGLIAWGARVRIAGPSSDEEQWAPLEYFYLVPQTSSQPTLLLKPGQLITHIWLPDSQNRVSASYEVLQLEGLDWPLAAAACTLEIEGGVVREARIVLGHVAPIPWLAQDAARFLVGQAVTEDSAERAGDMAVSRATPLSMNEYKVQLARTAVKRAILKAAGHWEEEV